MGTKTKRTSFKIAGIFIIGLFWHAQLHSTELVELNRVVAKVNERVVTLGEIENAMTLLNFTDQEKKARANEFVDGKIDRLLSIIAFREKGMQIPEAYINSRTIPHLLCIFSVSRMCLRWQQLPFPVCIL